MTIKNKGNGYKGVDCQSLENEINGNEHPSPVISNEQRESNPYEIVGTCRMSKTGKSLSIKLGNGKEARYFSISKYDIESVFHNPLTVADMREYDSPPKPLIIMTNINLD